MNNFAVTVTIRDACCSKCCNSVFERTLNNFTNTSYSNLQNGFAFTILSITDDVATVTIQNGVCYYIRRVPLNQSIPFCLPCKCGQHIVTITINAIYVI